MRGRAEPQPSEGGSGTPLDLLLAHLKRTRGFDFSGYKRASLERRIRKRMDAIGVDDYGEYLDYLEVHQDEFPALFDVILINVTGFFRDAASWDYYAGEILPRLLEAVGPDDPIRVWCAGCASGEEWQTWRSNTSHFASKEHFDFSMKNRGGSPTVTRQDVAMAQQQNWFGRAVTVDQGQILER